ncbi:MAG: hypothetical protein ACK557_00505 [Planctomycetota bacterium]
MSESVADSPELRFAVLHHRLPPAAERSDHFDLLLEWRGALLTWELPIRPLLIDQTTAARRLPDHRLVYLDYSGPLTENRGHVQLVDTGFLTWIQTPDAALESWTATLTQPAAVTQPAPRWCLSLASPAPQRTDWVVDWRRLR